MNARERFHAVMNRQPVDRMPIVEWAVWWDKTIDRWQGEGLPNLQSNRYAIAQHFGLDQMYQLGGYSMISADAPKPAHHGAGIIKDEADFERIRKFFCPPIDDSQVVAPGWEADLDGGEAILWYNLPGFFWTPRDLFGIEGHFYAFFDHPELMHQINTLVAEYHIAYFDAVCRWRVPDMMCFAEDMSYNHGSMLSKALFDEFLAPYYRRVIGHIKATRPEVIVFVDSDGDIHEPAAWFAEVGVYGMLPLERQAGVDVAAIRKALPAMNFIGCFDKMTMNRGESAMRAEFERLLPVAKQGGLIISCDHQTPPGVSYEQYQTYLRLLREYAVKVGAGR